MPRQSAPVQIRGVTNPADSTLDCTELSLTEQTRTVTPWSVGGNGPFPPTDPLTVQFAAVTDRGGVK